MRTNEDIWVTGAEQRIAFSTLHEWNRFSKAVVARIADGKVERALEYEGPRERSAKTESPSQIFKAATISRGRAWLCTLTEVLECDFPSFRIRRAISHPCFNDLHHVLPSPDGRIFVAVTGLDSVAELSPEGELTRLISVIDRSPWERFSRRIDYRRVRSTKPHRSHPNFLFFLGDRLWVTRFEQRDAVPVQGVRVPEVPEVPETREGTDRRSFGSFGIGLQGAHDGHVAGGRLLFTTVDGHLVRFGLRDGSRQVIDLNGLRAPGDDRPLGWCRGLLPVDGRHVWVGFTRIRYTRLRRNLSWIRHGFREGDQHRQRPTRIALYDLETPALLREVDLETVGLGALFSIHAAPARPAAAAEEELVLTHSLPDHAAPSLSLSPPD